MQLTATLERDLEVLDAKGRRRNAGDRILLRTAFGLKDAIKGNPEKGEPGLPGRLWDGDRRVWHVPATVETAAKLQALIDRHRLLDVDVDRGVLDLLARAEQSRDAQANKQRDDLPEIPGRYCACPGGATRTDPETGQDTQGICAACHEVIESWMHQRQAYHWAQPREGAGLQMDMGTGKSKVAISLADGWGAQRMIICAPPNAVRIWPRQFRDMSARDWVVVNHGGEDRQGRRRGVDRGANGKTIKATMAQRLEAAIAGADLAARTGRPFCVVLPYEVMWRDPIRSWMLDKDRGWDVAVGDESHRIKAPGGKWSKTMDLLGRRARRRLVLTGTMMPHDQLDVYAQMRFADPGIFGTSFQRFKDHFFAWGGYEGRELEGFRSPEAEREFLELLGGATIVIEDDVLDLPPQLDQPPVRFELGDEARRRYAEMLEEWSTDLADVDPDEDEARLEARNVLAQMVRLAQITSGHLPKDRLVATGATSETEDLGALIYRLEREIVEIGDEKAQALETLLEDVPPGERIVVFARFRHDLDRIRAIAERQGRAYGEISGRDKSALDADGRMAAGVELAGVQLQAGGVGIDLTAARYAIYYSLDFNLGDFDQSRKRVHRPGQRRSVLYYYIVAAGTIDETILAALRSRSSVVRGVIRAIKTGDHGGRE